MKFNKNLKIIYSSLVLAPFIMFEYTSATETVNTNEIEGEIQCDIQNEPVKVFFTDVNGNVDENFYLKNYYINSYRKTDVCFLCELVCKRLDNLFQLHPLIQKYVDNLLVDLKLVIKQSNSGKIVDGKKVDCYGVYSQNNKFVDYIKSINLFTVKDGTYDVYLYNGNELLGSFKNVKFEKITK